MENVQHERNNFRFVEGLVEDGPYCDQSERDDKIFRLPRVGTKASRGYGCVPLGCLLLENGGGGGKIPFSLLRPLVTAVTFAGLPQSFDGCEWLWRDPLLRVDRSLGRPGWELRPHAGTVAFLWGVSCWKMGGGGVDKIPFSLLRPLVTAVTFAGFPQLFERVRMVVEGSTFEGGQKCLLMPRLGPRRDSVWEFLCLFMRFARN